MESIDGEAISLDDLTGSGPVVLRGFPGYQGPLCSCQVGELIAEAGARVVLAYPGPADALKARAEEFLGTRALTDHFDFVLDPDYALTDSYGLRRDAPNETAYPSTFVIGPDGVV